MLYLALERRGKTEVARKIWLLSDAYFCLTVIVW
jgi:hypothetical protein